MKQLKSLLLLLLLLCTSFVSAYPLLVVQQPLYDFGEEPTGALIEHEFILENQGDENLKIKNIKTSCGCTTPSNKTMLLKPGEKKPLSVVMDLKGRSGKQTQHVTLSTNDPNQMTYSLKITGEAVPNIRVEPRTLNLEQSKEDSSHQGELKLTSTKGKSFKVTSVIVNRDRVTSVIEHAEDGLSATIRITAKSQESQGHFTDVLKIETTDPAVGEIRVLVMWQVSTGISISPGQVNLVVSDTPGVLNRYIMVRGHPGLEEPLEVTGVEWPGQKVEISFEDTKKFGWRVHLKSFTPSESMKDSEILVHTNAEGFETLKIPVRLLEAP
jgi:hypothetical protein